MESPPTALPSTSPIHIKSVEPFVIEVPLAKPVTTPMATVQNVAMLFLRIEDADGTVGWGEIWCNYPRATARHRANLVQHNLRPLLEGLTIAHPSQAWELLTSRTKILVLQSGEPGPFAAAIAGVDLALWDIAAKKAQQPLWRFLGGESGSINAYASLSKTHDLRDSIDSALERGFEAVKFRVWNDVEEHLDACRVAREHIGKQRELMIDANSSWDLERAVDRIAMLREFNFSWLEEPIPVNAPVAAWERLAHAAPMRLAGGENMISMAAFDQALASEAIGVIQPDIAKWGGFTQLVPLSRRVVAAGRRFCPHMFSSGVGLMASAHLLAASNSPDGTLEYGIAFNPVRDALMKPNLRNGKLHLSDEPGLGIDVNLEQFDKYRVYSI